MGSVFFRRPTDDSSTSDGDDSEDEISEHGKGGLSQEMGEATDTINTESISSNGSVSNGELQEDGSAPFAHVDQHRNMLLSALLEDFTRNRACEEMNKANPGKNFNRFSPEIQPLAQKLFQQASQPLAVNGWITPSAAGENTASKQARATYLAGVESLALGNMQSGHLLQQAQQAGIASNGNSLALARQGNPVQAIAQRLPDSMTNLSLHQIPQKSSSPYSDLIFSPPTPRRSHYESSFRQLNFLGRGGFGAVYHTYNLFDKKEYAVKKIPLSPRLSLRYRESGHESLENILREVQALAQLEHSNIVRYHATWIEEPVEELSESVVYEQSRKPSLTVRGRKLIEAVNQTAADSNRLNVHSLCHAPPRNIRSLEEDDNIVFGLDSTSDVRELPERSALEKPSFNHPISMRPTETDSVSISARESEIFTDGNAIQNPANIKETVPDTSVYVLHVQMSVYPMTLAQYLAPTTSRASKTPTSMIMGSSRHCFHLVPALRILMGILCGLQYIHAKGLVHRDIKPSNVFLASIDLATGSLVPDGFFDVGTCTPCQQQHPRFVNPRIGDFGLVAELAKDMGLESSTSSNKPVGTEYYRPPPVRDAKSKLKATTIDEKLDVFAMGVILVELLWCCTTSTERMHVLQGLQRGALPAELKEKIDAEGHRAGTGDDVVQCIHGMIERDPGKRWDCAAVAERVQRLLDENCCLSPTRPRDHADVSREEMDTVALSSGRELSKVMSIEDVEDGSN